VGKYHFLMPQEGRGTVLPAVTPSKEKKKKKIPSAVNVDFLLIPDPGGHRLVSLGRRELDQGESHLGGAVINEERLASSWSAGKKVNPAMLENGRPSGFLRGTCIMTVGGESHLGGWRAIFRGREHGFS